MPKEKLKEADCFLKVPKLLFKQGMSPAEILIVSQILEFTSKGLPCYLTDAELALNIGASESTISRTIRDLANRGIVERETKMINGKRVRTLKADTSNLTPREVRKKLDHTVNLTVPSKQFDGTIQSNCRYPSQQIDRIKDNIKDKEEDNSIDKNESPKKLGGTKDLILVENQMVSAETGEVVTSLPQVVPHLDSFNRNQFLFIASHLDAKRGAAIGQGDYFDWDSGLQIYSGDKVIELKYKKEKFRF